MSTISNTILKWPITARLNPLKGQNWVYLCKMAAVTRLAIGGVRVLENHPSKINDPQMTVNDKRKSFIERIFIEFFGTTAYLLVMHLGQDLAAKYFELTHRHKPDQLKKLVKAHYLESALSPDEVLNHSRHFNQAFDRIYGPNTTGLVDRVLNPRTQPGSTEKIAATWRQLSLELGGSSVTRRLPKEVEAFTKWANSVSTKSIMSGVIIGAIFGGFAIQWLNDQILGPVLKSIYGPADTPGSGGAHPANPALSAIPQPAAPNLSVPQPSPAAPPAAIQPVPQPMPTAPLPPHPQAGGLLR